VFKIGQTSSAAVHYDAHTMATAKLPVRAVLHECPICHHPQVKIQRKLDNDRLGATNYVCSRAGDCVLGFNLTKVDTWVVV
jgi:hypothetical protein